MAGNAKAERRRIQAVGAVIYRLVPEGLPEILLIRKRGGYWTLPKGRLLPDESPVTGLLREVAEETGLNGEVEQLVKIVRYVTPQRRPQRRKVVSYYLFAAIDAELRLSQSEHIEEARWMTFTTAVHRARRRRIRRVIDTAAGLLKAQHAQLAV